MRTSFPFALSIFVTAALAFAAGVAVEQRRSPDLSSHIYRKADARKSSGDWGAIHIHIPETASTGGLASLLTAELEFLPGKQLQPPHQHAEEELQYIIEGGGRWFLKARTF